MFRPTLYGAAALIASLSPLHAMEFSVSKRGDAPASLLMIGAIFPGDAMKLKAYLAADLATAATIKLAMLASPGGNILEAETMATMIRSNAWATGVPKGIPCASACFLLFAAGTVRMAAPESRIGVHSAGIDGVENATSLAATTLMARDAAALGVPAAILGRMVTNKPGEMGWLTGAELSAMGVRFVVSDAPASPDRKASLPSTVSSAPQQGALTATASLSSPLFAQGQADRRAWEQWFGDLGGDYQSGAAFWTSQRSLRHPSPCISPLTGATNDMFALGCQAAKQRLDHADQMRRLPDYKMGWNSL